MKIEDRPFWLDPPYMILFDLLRLHRVKPFDVDIVAILNSFMKEMAEKGYIDFSASGTALLSSSIIYKMKTELLLKMEEPPPRKVEKPDEAVPPPLPMPLRFRYTATSITEVIDALLSTLEREQKITSKRVGVSLQPLEAPKLDEFFLNIEERIDSFYRSLKEHVKLHGEFVSFIEYNRGLPILNVVRNFILLLFLVSQERLMIEQEEEGNDIRIALV